MIPIQNTYYMLSYAFQALQAQNYKDLTTENFHNTAELCAAILDKGISIQLKRGLGRDYVPKSESLSTLQGKLNISESIKTQTLLKKQMICTYDEFSTNTQFNQIIKSTMLLLLKANITNTRKKSLRNLLLFFSNDNEIDLRFVNWNQHYNRSNQSYQMLIGICYLIYNGLLQTQTDGTTKIMDFFDEQRLCRLYEKFLLEYYRKEHPELSANASQIACRLHCKWQRYPFKQKNRKACRLGRRISSDLRQYYRRKYYGNPSERGWQRLHTRTGRCRCI